jgi:hypothetical protein
MNRRMSLAHRCTSLILLLAALLLPACRGTQRPTRDTAQLLEIREKTRETYHAVTRERFLAVLQRTHAQLEAYKAGNLPSPPTIDVLAISGGGDWGAFGAGFLKGWRSIDPANPLALPEFDAVTGVSTGALIAPFAFLGDQAALDKIEFLYRHPQRDWMRDRGLFFFLPHNISFATNPGLERDLKQSVDLAFAQRIVDEGNSGRILTVNTTNLDDASPRVFSLVIEARRAVKDRDMSRLHNIILASAGIPGAFPYRDIDGTMYVDGGVTANIIYGGRLRSDESIPALWQQLYPNDPIPPIRYWVLFNNKLRTLPKIVPARWPTIVTRSIETSIRSSTLTSIRHLYAMAEVFRLKYNANVEVRVAAIPDDWSPPAEGDFNTKTMNALVDLGEQLGSQPEIWLTDIDDY